MSSKKYSKKDISELLSSVDKSTTEIRQQLDKSISSFYNKKSILPTITSNDINESLKQAQKFFIYTRRPAVN